MLVYFDLLLGSAFFCIVRLGCKVLIDVSLVQVGDDGFPKSREAWLLAFCSFGCLNFVSNVRPGFFLSDQFIYTMENKADSPNCLLRGVPFGF